MKNNGTTVTEKDNYCNKEENIELQEVWKELGFSSKDETALASQFTSNSASDTGGKLHPILALGIGAGVLFNIGILLSLPPVLRGKGRFKGCCILTGVISVMNRPHVFICFLSLLQ
jgi:hypothetical protein